MADLCGTIKQRLCCFQTIGFQGKEGIQAVALQRSSSCTTKCKTDSCPRQEAVEEWKLVKMGEKEFSTHSAQPTSSRQHWAPKTN